MSKPTFTAGPWKIVDHDEEYIMITDNDQMYGVCKLEKSASESRQVMLADAALIAAAPEMLEALKNVQRFINQTFNADVRGPIGDEIRNAIAKAEGRE